MPFLSGPVSNTYFDFHPELDYCVEHEFVVEAVNNISNEHARENSSEVSGHFIGGKFYFRVLKCSSNYNLASVPSFRNLSGMLIYRHQCLHLNVSHFKKGMECD